MIRRLYTPDLSEGKMTIKGSEAHHAINVLRVKLGDDIELFDGKGGYAQGEIIGIDKSEIEIIVNKIEISERAKSTITLAFAVPKYSKQETLILMCSELGILRFVPVVFSRSSVRENIRTEKWFRWSIQACKQSRRNYLPEIANPVKFEKFIAEVNEYDCIVYGEHRIGDKPPMDFSRKKNVLIIVGPEGGFTEQELQTIQSRDNAYPMRIGHYILRIETAAIALSSVVSYLIGSDS